MYLFWWRLRHSVSTRIILAKDHLSVKNKYTSCAKNPHMKSFRIFDRKLDHHHKLEHGHHLVHFYEDQAALVLSVTDFVVPGINQGEGIILVAEASNLTKFRTSLAVRGIDLAKVEASRQLILLDAHQTLSSFMVNGMPDSHLFFKTVYPLMDSMSANFPSIRAYGEMVNILWKEKNPEAVLQLESLWNELSHKYKFSLLCGYDHNQFDSKKNEIFIRQISRTHTHFIPTDSFSPAF
jgi:hypothetical protein